MYRKAAVTGIGVISSIGIGRDAFWKALREGRCGIGEVTLFDTSGYKGRLAAQVLDFNEKDFTASFSYSKGVRFDRLSRCDMFGILAVQEALIDSGLDIEKVEKERLAVVIGSGASGLLSAEKFKRQLISGRRPRPSLLMPFYSSAFTDCIAMLVGSKGFRATISTACSSSTTAIGMAGEIIRKGIADVVITGGSESLSETTFGGFNSLRVVDDVPCRPFDRERKGISLGEGAAIFIVEDYEGIGGRKSYGEIAGYGLSVDAYHVTTPSPDGLPIAEAIRFALKDSDMDITDINYINAHGTGTPANDVAETRAIKAVFGSRAYNTPVSSTKSMIGHCLGAAGALEAAASFMAIVKGIIPPTINYLMPDPECDLDYVPEKARYKTVRAVLSNSLAFGGNNTALILRCL